MQKGTPKIYEVIPPEIFPQFYTTHNGQQYPLNSDDLDYMLETEYNLGTVIASELDETIGSQWHDNADDENYYEES